MQFTSKSVLNQDEKKAIRQLWNNEYPEVIAMKSLEEFDAYLEPLKDQNHVLVQDENEKLQAWFFDFVRNDERNFAMIVSRQTKGKGLGRKLIEDAKTRWPELNGWVVKTVGLQRLDGTIYPNPRSFYEKQDFLVLEDQVWKTEEMETLKITWKRSKDSN